jgi:hypothetical protein
VPSSKGIFDEPSNRTVSGLLSSHSSNIMLSKVLEYSLPGITVQVIHLDTQYSPTATIRQSFDFKFLANTFDGNELRIM